MAPSTRRPPTSTVISGPVSVSNCARSTSASSGAMNCALAADVVAEAVGARLERREGFDVGLLLRRVHAARREGHLHVDAGVLRGLLDRGAAAEHDQVGERDLLAEAPSGSLRASPAPSSSCAGWLTSQSFCGLRRMRAPLAPPRLSEPRNVEADAQAVETSCDTDRPEARIFAFSAAMSCVADQRMIRPPGSGPARSASPSAPAGRGSARSGPCRGA